MKKMMLKEKYVFLIYGDNASPAIMLLNDRVPHSSYFMYNET